MKDGVGPINKTALNLIIQKPLEESKKAEGAAPKKVELPVKKMNLADLLAGTAAGSDKKKEATKKAILDKFA